ncbi:MAG: hypothetical protein QOK25_3119 [Thermoleophilaceae bacterium]|nr:hypothetical protein [Thermoleophilaceae bacterium]
MLLRSESSAPPERPPKVAHLTVVHHVDDVRIFVKQCRTLSAAGYEVHLIAPSEEDTELDGVLIHGLRQPGCNRLVRMTTRGLNAFRTARRLDADVYHVHDPELMPVALFLRLLGKKVVYDSHEHLPQQILTKPWIPAWLRHPLSVVADLVESTASRLLSAVVTAEPYVRDRFVGRAPTVITVNNYPMISEFGAPAEDWSSREEAVCYAGDITELRGIRKMIGAIEGTDARLLLAGRFSPPGLEGEVAREPGWSQVEFLGHLPRPALTGMLARARAGLVVLSPVPNYVQANPTKMFEYMAAGIPVIASNFPAWATIVNRHECGLCVDPESETAIAAAINWIMEHPAEAARMGANGRRAVERLYSWEAEREKLLALYEQLIGRGEPASSRLTAAVR